MAKIFLCGFFAAGKSYTAEKIAKLISYKYIDLDKEVSTKENRTIASIIREGGEEYFREFENKHLKNIIEKDDICVAVGGGCLLLEDNVKLIKDAGGLLFFLDTDINTILDRIEKEDKRPFLKRDGKEKTKELFKKRREIYLKASDYTLTENYIFNIIDILNKNKII